MSNRCVPLPMPENVTQWLSDDAKAVNNEYNALLQQWRAIRRELDAQPPPGQLLMAAEKQVVIAKKKELAHDFIVVEIQMRNLFTKLAQATRESMSAESLRLHAECAGYRDELRKGMESLGLVDLAYANLEGILHQCHPKFRRAVDSIPSTSFLDTLSQTEFDSQKLLMEAKKELMLLE